MGLIDISLGGSFDKSESWLKKALKDDFYDVLVGYAEQGVNALSNATPQDTGLTAESWSYEIVRSIGRHAIIFHNSHVVEGRPIAILIQYGHGTATGGYVEGRDYINPVIRPLFDKIANDVWKAVTK